MNFIPNKNVFFLILLPLFSLSVIYPKKLNLTNYDPSAIINSPQLLKDLFSKKYFLEFKNITDSTTTVNISTLFKTFSEIDSEIAINENDNSQTKIIKIYNYVAKMPFKLTWYKQSVELSSPLLSFINSTYLGDCGIAATIMCQLSRHYGYDCRYVHLNDHAVAEVFYNNKWHLFDPTGIGIIKEKNDLVDLEFATNLAKLNKLPKYNLQYDPRFKGQILDLPDVNENDLTKPILANFLPLEKKKFFNYFYLISQSSEKDRNYEGLLHSFTREIPLKNYKEDLQISDFFPIIGAYIIVPKEKSIATANFPLLSTSNLKPNSYYIGKYQIIDYSEIINKDRAPPMENIILKNIYKIPTDSSASLVTLHFYANNSAKIDFNTTTTLDMPKSIQVTNNTLN